MAVLAIVFLLASVRGIYVHESLLARENERTHALDRQINHSFTGESLTTHNHQAINFFAHSHDYLKPFLKFQNLLDTIIVLVSIYRYVKNMYMHRSALLT